ncbi:HlyD family secretion protein [Lachnotalea sp. AF33-28]|uniref:HlyD family secretion protein n=1 Tax=Lachnotalea sp. AF33-28 TaxID=2292046 RepID=UPI001313F06F|nr:HlyD family secretion protein [Lachnotalea sp. AF33-28]
MAGLLKEKWKEFCPHKAKWMKVTAAVFVLALVCAITVPIVYANAEQNKNAEKENGSTLQASGTDSGQSGLINGSGVTEAGTKDQILETDLAYNLALVVEEVYVASGDTVSEGDALYKFTDESLSAAIAWLEKEQASDKTALDTARTDYDAGVLKAEYQRQSDRMQETTAELTYNAETEALAQQVESAAKAIAGADEKIASYTEKLENNTYASEYKLDELLETQTEKGSIASDKENALTARQSSYEAAKAEADPVIQALKQEIASCQQQQENAQGVYDDALNALFAAVLEENTQQPDVSGNTVESSSLSGNTVSDNQVSTDADLKLLVENVKNAKGTVETLEAEYEARQKELQEQNAKLKDLETEVLNAEKELQTAKLEYQKAVNAYNQAYSACSQATEKAKTELESLQNNYANLTAAYQEALIRQISQNLSLKESYDGSMLIGQNADTVYQLTVASLQKAVDAAQETYDQVTGILERISSIAETGTVTAEYDGQLTDVAYEASDRVFGSAVLVSYLDLSDIKVSISVAQDRIAEVAVGDEARITVSGASFSGTVSEIAGQKDSGGSVSSVNYTVTVAIEDESGSLGAGYQAAVILMQPGAVRNPESDSAAANGRNESSAAEE